MGLGRPLQDIQGRQVAIGWPQSGSTIIGGALRAGRPLQNTQVVSSGPEAAQLWMCAPLWRPTISIHKSGWLRATRSCRWGPLRGWGNL